MITSGSNNRVKQIVQWQKVSRERNQAGVFLVEGFKMLEEAPSESVAEIYVAEGALERLSAFPELKQKLERIGYENVADSVFAKMSDTKTPQGILLVMRQPVYTLEQMTNVPFPLLVLIESLQDPGNLGTIIRTGEGAGVTGVILSEDTVDIFNPKTIRATMGSVFRVPFLYVENLRKVIQRLHERGIQTYAAHLEGKRYYDGVSYRQGTAFLIGNEGRGLSRETAKLAGEYVKIPMEGQVESLNAAVAASLLMYEAHRQRQTG